MAATYSSSTPSIPYRIGPADPAISRMDSIHRCAIAFLWIILAVRRAVVMRGFFRAGVLRLDGQVRGAFPPGPDAPWHRPFLEAVRCGDGGASFERYGAGGFPDATRRRVIQDSAAIIREASGERLLLRRSRPRRDLSVVTHWFF